MESASSTYQAVQAVAPGRLELVRKPIRDPGPSVCPLHGPQEPRDFHLVWLL